MSSRREFVTLLGGAAAGRESATLRLISPHMSAVVETGSRTGDGFDLGRAQVHGGRRLCI